MWSDETLSQRSSFKRVVRVLHVGPGRGQLGGIASMMGELENLQARFRRANIVFSFFETHGFQSARNLLGFALLDLPRFILVLMRDVDIVHLHVSVRGSFYRKFVFSLLAKLTGRKTIFHLHAGNFDRFESRAGKLTRLSISRFVQGADAAVAVSVTIGQELIRLGVDPAKLYVIGNTAGSAEFVKDAGLPTLKNDGGYLAFAGRLVEAKGIGDLLKALALLRAAGCVISLKLAGDGDVHHWQRMACDFQVDDLVTFAGWLDSDAKLEFYRNARVFCMPSHYESFGISTLEAMFSGVPVIGTRLGGFLDLVEEGVTGYLVEPSSPQALAARIRRLMEDPELAERMGKAGLARARQCYSTEALSNLYVRCYRDVVAH
ncbi:glycosyltransferase family 4 protein [Paraburkholderia panacisoli]|uniref:Glycosyltransferase family 4 protein n=1 Tax=Paraburkholderia panacisoli TaxID=2603818 RepID=A0A5B0HA62_9BURK|nr:glycosyltransferase family 4 protein [Paraburkholderia panacisoli]KAA1012038.1 glycosyltransferase family 4 protein [Paraburkholderia panacisoli]